jgi:hypothetical protein
MRPAGLAIALMVVAGCSFQVIPAETGGDGGAGVPLKKRITIDPAQVMGAQAGFPVWIALDDPDLANGATPGGEDIHFTGADGAALPHEIQRWDRAAGRLEAWVRADLADDAPTVLELRYGDPGATRAPEPAAVFASGFAAVWHLDDRLDTMAVAEARGERVGTALGGLNPSHQVAAQLGGGIDFDGLVARIELVNPFTGNSPHTISAWVKQRTATGCDSIVTVGNPMSGKSRLLYGHFTLGANGVHTGFYANDWSPPGLGIQNTGWVLLHWVYQGGGARQSRIYLNGAEMGTHAYSGGISTEGTGGHIGYAPPQWNPDQTNPCALNGVLDEVRLATAVRDAGWIATEHANQSSPQTFYTVGPEEPVR